MRDIIDIVERLGSGSETEETKLQTDHGVIPSDELNQPQDDIKRFGRSFQKRPIISVS